MKSISKTEQNITLYEDIIFVNKNKEYGAYALRRSYNRNLVIGFIASIIFFVLGITSLFIFRIDSPYDARIAENDNWIILVMKPDGSISAYDSVGTGIKGTAVPRSKKTNPIIKKSKAVKIHYLNVFPSTEMYRLTFSAIKRAANAENVEPVKEPELESVAEKQHLWVDNPHCNSNIQNTICSAVTANIVNKRL